MMSFMPQMPNKIGAAMVLPMSRASPSAFKWEKLAANLIRLMQSAGYNQKSLAVDAGLHATAVRDIIKGRSKNPGIEKLQAIAGTLGKSLEELTGARPSGPAHSRPVFADPVAPVAVDALAGEHVEFDGLRYVAIRSFDLAAAAGAGADLPGLPAVKNRALFRHDWLRRVTGAAIADLAIIRVEGDSMTPTLQDGDSVLIDQTQRRPDKREGIYVINNDGLSQIKRVSAHPVTKRLSIMSDNPVYPTYHDLPPDQIDIVGRVIWIGRQA